MSFVHLLLSSTDELADIDWDNIDFGHKPTDYMYAMKCSRDGDFSKGELQRFGNIQVNPSAAVLNYGQVRNFVKAMTFLTDYEFQ